MLQQPRSPNLCAGPCPDGRSMWTHLSTCPTQTGSGTTPGSTLARGSGTRQVCCLCTPVSPAFLQSCDLLEFETVPEHEQPVKSLANWSSCSCQEWAWPSAAPRLTGKRTSPADTFKSLLLCAQPLTSALLLVISFPDSCCAPSAKETTSSNGASP